MRIVGTDSVGGRPIDICIATEAAPEGWDGYVNRHPHASPYHLGVFGTIIATQFSHRPYYLFSRNMEGELSGVLPLVHVNSKLFGNYMLSMPYFNYGGPLGDNENIELRLLSEAGELAYKLGVNHLESRDVVPRSLKWPFRNEKITMVLALPNSTETLWKQLGAKRRSQIKRPQREAVEIRHGNRELLDDFYAVFSRNMRDLGTPVYSKRFFVSILESVPETHIVVVKWRSKPVAAGFLLGFRGRLEIPWASSLREANPIGVNMLLYWEALKYAIDSGYDEFDFGRCTVGSNTYKFKKQWGANEQQLYWYYWLKSGQCVPQLNPDNPKYKPAIAVWQHLPLMLANRLGPLLSKDLP